MTKLKREKRRGRETIKIFKIFKTPKLLFSSTQSALSLSLFSFFFSLFNYMFYYSPVISSLRLKFSDMFVMTKSPNSPDGKVYEMYCPRDRMLRSTMTVLFVNLSSRPSKISIIFLPIISSLSFKPVILKKNENFLIKSRKTQVCSYKKFKIYIA